MTDYSVRRFHKYADSELVQMLLDLATKRETAYVSAHAFEQATGVSEATVANHFGTWRAFCERAGLKPRYTRSPSRAELFEILDDVWTRLGRQPRAKEMKQPLSSVSISQYSKIFGKPWFDICVEFLASRSGLTIEQLRRETESSPTSSTEVRESRGINLSLRHAVMHRDRFRCVLCGRSPATDLQCQIHIDHIVPWSKGGKTVLENLRCTCSQCNIGRSNRFDD
jgi:hypothetical protein